MSRRNKRRMFGAFCVLSVLGLIAFFIPACEDFGVEADFFKGTVKGKLTLESDYNEATDEIRVFLSPDFPPSNFLDLQISEAIDNATLKAKGEVPFDMQVPYGDYEAAVVIWKGKGLSWDLTDIVGLWGNLERFELRSIELNEAHPTEDSVNIPIDLSRVNRTANIAGTIDFVGEWPSNTFLTGLVVYRKITDLIAGQLPHAFLFFSVGADSVNYNVGVLPDTYELIAVAWLPQGFTDLIRDIRIIGQYRDITDPASVTVPDNATVDSVNFVADFSRIQ